MTSPDSRKLTIQSLPDDLIALCLSFVGPMDVICTKYGLVCTRWAKIIFDGRMWNRFSLTGEHITGQQLLKFLENRSKPGKLLRELSLTCTQTSDQDLFKILGHFEQLNTLKLFEFMDSSMEINLDLLLNRTQKHVPQIPMGPPANFSSLTTVILDSKCVCNWPIQTLSFLGQSCPQLSTLSIRTIAFPIDFDWHSIVGTFPKLQDLALCFPGRLATAGDHEKELGLTKFLLSCTSLTSLSLTRCHALSFHSIMSLLSELSTLKNLSFDICTNVLSCLVGFDDDNLQASAVTLPTIDYDLPLEHLSLTHFGVEAASQFFELMKFLPNLKSFAFNPYFDTNGMADFMTHFLESPFVGQLDDLTLEIDLENGDGALVAIGNACKNLTKLRLMLGEEMTARDESFVQLLNNMSKLKNLTILLPNVSQTTYEAIMTCSPSLTDLTICAEAGFELSPLSSALTNLTSLRLEFRAQDDTYRNILSSCPNLQSLTFSGEILCGSIFSELPDLCPQLTHLSVVHFWGQMPEYKVKLFPNLTYFASDFEGHHMHAAIFLAAPKLQSYDIYKLRSLKKRQCQAATNSALRNFSEFVKKLGKDEKNFFEKARELVDLPNNELLFYNWPDAVKILGTETPQLMKWEEDEDFDQEYPSSNEGDGENDGEQENEAEFDPDTFFSQQQEDSGGREKEGTQPEDGEAQ